MDLSTSIETRCGFTDIEENEDADPLLNRAALAAREAAPVVASRRVENTQVVSAWL